MAANQAISVGTYVLVDGDLGRRALVECQGDAPGTWDICFDDDRTEAAGVPDAHLVIDSSQPARQSRDEVLANIAFLQQKNKGRLAAPDLVWKNELGGAVYVGSMHSASDRKAIGVVGITHVVNCTSDLPCTFESSGGRGGNGGGEGTAATRIEYLRFDAIDIFSRRSPSAGDPERDILGFFDPVFQFVDAATAAGGSVLIHCVAGAHRAGTTACAYVMHRDHTLTAAGAIAHCKGRRAVIDPHISVRLVRMLELLEAAHAGTTASMQSQHPGGDTDQSLDLNVEGYKVLAALGPVNTRVNTARPLGAIKTDASAPRVLFLCGGNQGRSVLCHYITLLHGAAPTSVASAGEYADSVDAAPDAQAVGILGGWPACAGIAAHVPTQLTASIVAAARPDIVLVATAAQLDAFAGVASGFPGRVARVLEFAAAAGATVPAEIADGGDGLDMRENAHLPVAAYRRYASLLEQTLLPALQRAGLLPDSAVPQILLR